MSEQLTTNQVQELSEQIGVVLGAFFQPTASFGYLCGLCPRCKQPIAFHLTNGGKLHAARTLRMEHVFSGDVMCEEAPVNEWLQGKTGEQKVEFFSALHDYKVFVETGLSASYVDNRMEKLHPGWKETLGPMVNEKL